MTKYLLRYQPIAKMVDPDHWEKIREFTLAAAAEAAPLTSYEAKAIVGPLAQYVDWHSTSGVPLDRAQMFTRANVDKFIKERTKHMVKGSRSNYRAVLRRVVEAFDEPQQPSGKPLALTASTPAERYSPAVELAHRAMARNQATRSRRENAELLLGLGYGVGLPTEEIAILHGIHVVEVPGGVEIHVPGRRARVVPVLPEWESVILAAAHRVGEGMLFLPNREGYARNLLNKFVSDLDHGGAPRISTQRMRATWIVRMLNAGIRVNVIMAMAGVTDYYAIGRYVQFMDEVPAAQAHADLRAVGAAAGSVGAA